MDEDEDEVPQELLLACAELEAFIIKWIPIDEREEAQTDLTNLVDRHLAYYLAWRRNRNQSEEPRTNQVVN